MKLLMEDLSRETGGHSFYWQNADAVAGIITDIICGAGGFRLVNVSHNIKEIAHPKFSLIDTANMPFNVYYYNLSVIPVSLGGGGEAYQYDLIRLIKPEYYGEERFVIDSDLVVDCAVYETDVNTWLNVTHEYTNGVRTETYYQACHEKMCEMPECDCSGNPLCKLPPMKDKNSMFTQIPRCCGGITKEEKYDCMCCQKIKLKVIPTGCEDPVVHTGDPAPVWHAERYRLEVKSDYGINTIETEDQLVIPRVLHKDINRDTKITMNGTVEEYEIMGDKVMVGVTEVTFNKSIPVAGFGIEHVDSDSVMLYNPLYYPVKHKLWKKKSSPGPLNREYDILDYYGYLSEDFRVPKQCKLLCPIYCECPSDNKMEPVCTVTTKPPEEILNETLALLLCQEYWSYFEPIYGDLDTCVKGLNSSQPYMEEMCEGYLHDIGFIECAERGSNMGCVNERRGDKLFEGCLYAYGMEIRYDCVCAIEQENDPCNTTREFHEEEGGRIVNGDFEMGRLGPWKTIPDSLTEMLPGDILGDPVVIWNGAQGYSLAMKGGSAMYQMINPTHGDPDRMLCFDYSINETRAGLLLILLDYEGDVDMKEIIIWPCIPDIPSVDLPFENIPGYCLGEGWHQHCIDIPYDKKLSGIAIAAFSPSTITDFADYLGFDPTEFEVFGIDLEMLGLAGDQTFLIDNINLGKYHDFVHHYTQLIKEMGRVADLPLKDTNSFGSFSVAYANTSIENGIKHLTMYYEGQTITDTKYFEGGYEPYNMDISEFTESDFVIFSPDSDADIVQDLFPQTDTCTPKCMADYESCKLHGKPYDAYCRTACQTDEEWAGGTGDDWCGYRFDPGHQCCCCVPP